MKGLCGLSSQFSQPPSVSPVCNPAVSPPGAAQARRPRWHLPNAVHLFRRHPLSLGPQQQPSLLPRDTHHPARQAGLPIPWGHPETAALPEPARQCRGVPAAVMGLQQGLHERGPGPEPVPGKPGAGVHRGGGHSPLAARRGSLRRGRGETQGCGAW